MNYWKLLTGISFVLMLSACGGGGGSSDGGLSSAKSQLCSDLTGLEAVYWDFINGVPRGDLPSTAFTIPFNVNTNQISYTNSNPSGGLLLGFTVPQGWTATDAVDVSGFAFPTTVVGSDLIRSDNQAVWRYMMSAQVTGGFTAESIMNAEVNTAISYIGNPASVSSQCELNAQQNGILGLESHAAKIVRAGDFTIMAKTHVTFVNGVGAFYDSFLSLAPTSESTTLINDIFVPMITQLYGGGSDPKACSDGLDNDGDGKTDYPDDPECKSPSDDNESA